MPSKANTHQTVDIEIVAGHRVETVDVIVQHRDTDSFTRSVDAAARRYLADPAKVGHAHEVALIDGSRYAAEKQYAARDPKPWCISFIRARITR